MTGKMLASAVVAAWGTLVASPGTVRLTIDNDDNLALYNQVYGSHNYYLLLLPAASPNNPRTFAATVRNPHDFAVSYRH